MEQLCLGSGVPRRHPGGALSVLRDVALYGAGGPRRTTEPAHAPPGVGSARDLHREGQCGLQFWWTDWLRAGA